MNLNILTPPKTPNKDKLMEPEPGVTKRLACSRADFSNRMRVVFSTSRHDGILEALADTEEEACAEILRQLAANTPMKTPGMLLMDPANATLATRILRAIFREHYDANKNEDPEACVKLLVQQRDELRARVAALEATQNHRA